jgi:hypothetical protein
VADIKVRYPTANADSVEIACTLTSLASSASLVAGREATAVDNTTNLDVDHIITGNIRVGASNMTANTVAELWLILPSKTSGGTPTWPDVFDGTDSAETVTNRNALLSHGILLGSVVFAGTDANVNYPIGPASVAAACGGSMPPRYTPFIVHNGGQALSATASDHWLHYTRIQAQTV